MSTMEPVPNALLQYKAWGDRELMGFLCEQQQHLDAEVLHKALRLMNHIHVVDCIFVAHLQGQAHSYTIANTPETPTPEELSWRMQETNAVLLTLARPPLPEQRIHFDFTDGDKGGMNASEMLLHVCMHSTYHRGQVGQMLKDAGFTPPRELLTRKLHTEEPGRRVAQG